MADTKRTESDLKNNIFPDIQAAGSIAAQDIRDFVTSVPDWIATSGGWEFVFDDGTGATTLADGVPQQLTINSNPAEELRYPPGFAGIWDQANDRLFPPFLNGAGVLRLSMFGEFTGGTAPHLDLKLDVGSDPIAPAGGGTASNIIYTDSPNFAKATGDPQAFNFIIPLFIGGDFAANGGVFIINSHGNDVDISQITLTGIRIFNPMPGASVL